MPALNLSVWEETGFLNHSKGLSACFLLFWSSLNYFLGCLGRPTSTVYLISAPDQPGRKRMYHYIREAKRLLSYYIYSDEDHSIIVWKELSFALCTESKARFWSNSTFFLRIHNSTTTTLPPSYTMGCSYLWRRNTLIFCPSNSNFNKG